MTVEWDGGWVAIGDSFGDWRATNEARGLRTRLKRSLEWVQKDIESGRLQMLIGDQWIDHIDRFDRQHAYV